MDLPATPVSKLEVRRQQARQFGKEFDEALERRVLGLPEIENPEFIAASEERMRLTVIEDTKGRAEMEKELAAARERAQAADWKQKDMLINQQQEQIEEMQRQIAELMGQRPPTLRAVPAAAAEGEPARIEGEPDATWKLNELVEYASQHGVVVPKNGLGMTKYAVVNHIRGELAKREEIAAGAE